MLKKYKQFISWPGGDGLATITQEYDSLGRVIKEYGYNNSGYPAKQSVDRKLIYRSINKLLDLRPYIHLSKSWIISCWIHPVGKKNIYKIDFWIYPYTSACKACVAKGLGGCTR